MTQCKEGAQRQGLMLDTNEEIYIVVHPSGDEEPPRGLHHEPQREWLEGPCCHFACPVQSLRPQLVWRLVGFSLVPGWPRVHGQDGPRLCLLPSPGLLPSGLPSHLLASLTQGCSRQRHGLCPPEPL